MRQGERGFRAGGTVFRSRGKGGSGAGEMVSGKGEGDPGPDREKVGMLVGKKGKGI